MNQLCLLGGLGAGAGLMYIFDPVQGRRRRALLRDQGVRFQELQGRGAGSHGCGSTWKTYRASSRPARRQQPEASPLRDISLSTFPTPPALPACLVSLR